MSGGTWEARFGGSIGLEGVARGAGRWGAGGGREPPAAHLCVSGLLADRDVLRAAHGLGGQVGGHGGRRGRMQRGHGVHPHGARRGAARPCALQPLVRLHSADGWGRGSAACPCK